jgi:hypothetical protein
VLLLRKSDAREPDVDSFISRKSGLVRRSILAPRQK